ncbi:hypothetical protein DXG03_000503 [Asterophora parasitica]|uniref:Protein YIF1 n=1 Tax=Asterophora parasitica TaxID=117018 RepID=A0A9P7GAJ0_9AGAR|nr:hypothetical protein DXG03_000503 [Asterophora parasitica]
MSSPPPLRHPVPTHPAYIPEPPPTPSSPQGYQRFSSSPAPGPYPQHQAHHVPAYTSPFQHSQPQYAQPQPQQPAPHAPQPDFAAWGMNPTTAHLGMQLGQSAVAAGQDYVARNFGTIFPSTSLKHHFNVSNSYVIRKIRLILFPWPHKPSAWRRKVVAVSSPSANPSNPSAAQVEWAPPRDDLNAPDLYIPLMALVTYILLCALHAGLQKQFHTKVLGDSASRAVVVLLLDFVFVKLGCYFLNVPGTGQVVDLVAYGGYKFIGVILALIPALFLPRAPVLSTLLFIYAFLANAFFLLRSLRSLLLPDSHSAVSNPYSTPTSTATLAPAARRRRVIFLFLEAISQVLYMGILVRI